MKLGLWAGIGLVSLVMACSSSPSNPAGEGGAGGTGHGGQGGSSTSTEVVGSSSGGGVVVVTEPEWVAKLDAAKGERVEGLAIDGTTAYLSLAILNKVVKVDLETGAVSDFGVIPNAPLGVVYTLGLALDAQKNLYAAVSSDDPVTFKPGIYKFPKAGGEGTLFGENTGMSYPRAMSFDELGNMWIAAPPSAKIFLMTDDGAVEQVALSEHLAGDQQSPCSSGEAQQYGLSSISVSAGAIYGTNADRATVIEGGIAQGQVSVSPDPIAGPDCATLGGGEGLLEDPISFSLLMVSRINNSILSVGYTGDVKVLAQGKELNEPSALAIALVGGKRYLYVTNSAKTTFNKGGIPGLLRMEIGGTE